MTVATSTRRVQQDENTQICFQSIWEGKLPSDLDCGPHQKQVNQLKELFDRVPASGLLTALRAEIRNLMDADLHLAELLGDLLGYKKKAHHPEEPESPYQTPKEEEWVCPPALPYETQLDPCLVIGVCPELDWFMKYAARIAYRSYSGFYLTAALHLFSGIAAGRPTLQIGGNTYNTGLYLAHIANTTLDAKSYIERNVVERILRELELSFLFGGGGRNTSPEKFLLNLAGHVPDGWENLTKEEQIWREKILAFSAQRI